MMELTTCAFIVTLISVVTATPYGYGVKGVAGAFGGAESSAAAGSFGNGRAIPLHVPLGSAYSGSFSKSSASSSSSTSASSSSSSSSFTYNGSGGGSFSSPGTNGNTGCTSGICQDAGHQGPTGPISVNFHGYNAANSVAAAGSSPATGINCQGSQCDGQDGKCSSEQCQPKLPIEASINSHDSSNKCSSGQCGSTSQSVPSASQYDDSDDIHFVTHSSKSALDAKDHTSHDKSVGYTPDCRNGDCGSNLPATHLETPNLNSDCSSGNCKSGYDSSSTSYSVPIHGSPVGCNTPGCSNEFSSSGVNPKFQYDNNKPDTSGKKYPMYTGGFGGPPGMLKPNEFNVPISTTTKPVHFVNPTYSTPSTSITGSPTGCNTPGCSNEFPSSGVNPQFQYDNNKPNTSGIKYPLYTGGFGGPPGMLKPNEFNIPITTTSKPVHFVNPTYSTPSTSITGSPAGCKTPGCSNEFSSPGVNPQFQYDNNKPDTSGIKYPMYTGGFGGPPGMLTPNEFNIPITTTSKPVHIVNPTYSTPSTAVSAVTGCKTANCIESPTVTSTTAQSGSFSLHQDGGNVKASSNKPVYTGGFGGPAGMLKPDEFDIKVPVHSTNPSYNNHSPSSPAGCKTPNCNGYGTKPYTGAEPSSEIPLFTGGFGGPAGILKPNELNGYYNTPNTHVSSADKTTPQSSFGVAKPVTAPRPSFPGSTNNYRPVGVTYPGSSAVAPITPSYTLTPPLYPTGIDSNECKTGHCVGYPDSGTVVSAPSGSYRGSEGCKTGHCAGYPVTGTEALNTPSVPYGNSALCKTGNCAGHPTNTFSGSHINSKTDSHTSSGLYGHFAGCKTGNCATATNGEPSRPHGVTYPNNPSSPLGPSDSVLPSSSLSPKCKSPNCDDALSESGSYSGSKEQLPVYTGGFGGPSGLLKPNDYSKPDVTATPNKPSSGLPASSVTCSSSNCHPKEASPSSPGQNIGLNGVHATSSSSASANAVAYSGGFGGPPGFLIPYDNGKVDLAKISGGQNQISHYGGLTTGLTGTHSNKVSLGSSAAGATAVSGSTASANSGSLGFNSPENGTKGASPCGGGCGGGYQNGIQGSGSSAAAGAKSLSSAFGVGGNFALSSASAHSLAGAYTKGGYGKR